MSAIKLQKMVYYCQAWSLVLNDEPLFDESVEAWAFAPVMPEIHQRHTGRLYLSKWVLGDPNKLTWNQIDTISYVLYYDGAKTAQWFGERTKRLLGLKHGGGLALNERGQINITLDSMAEFYGSLPEDPKALIR